MGESAARTWKGMTPDQGNVFVLSITNEVTRRAALLKEGRVSFVKDDIVAAFTFASNATHGFFGGMESAYASNYPAQIGEMWGQLYGNIAIEVAAALIPAPKFQEFATATESLRLAENLNPARLITTQETKLRTLVTGLVDSETVLKAWGLGGQQLAEIQRVFAKLKVKGYFRERSPRAFELIDNLKEAVLKPEAIMPKGFSEIDDFIYNYDKRAVTIKQRLTRFVKDGRGHLIFFDGGLKSSSRALAADIQTAYEHFIRLFPDRRGLLPFLEPSKFNEALQRAGAPAGSGPTPLGITIRSFLGLRPPGFTSDLTARNGCRGQQEQPD